MYCEPAFGFAHLTKNKPMNTILLERFAMNTVLFFRRSMQISASALLLGAAVLLGPAAGLVAEPALETPPGVSESELKEAYKNANSLQRVYRAVYATVRPSVVRVVVENKVKVQPMMFGDPFLYRYFGLPEPKQGGQAERVQRAQGTGFIIDANGLIVTNAHVVGDSKTVIVKTSTGKEMKGEVRGTDKVTDIALIQVTDHSGLKPVRLGDSDSLSVGDFAIAVGNPFGLDGTFTTGVISAVGRAGVDANGGKFIQTDASINQGNSGGPLLNLDGEVIGINRMIFSPSGGSVGIGFAIPINEARDVISQIRETGSVVRPMLGIRISNLPEDRQAVSKGKGIYVHEVINGTGAAKAGVRPDDIILKVDGKDVNKPEDLVRYVRKKKIGDRVTLDILRDERTRSVSVLLTGQ